MIEPLQGEKNREDHGLQQEFPPPTLLIYRVIFHDASFERVEYFGVGRYRVD